MRSELEKYPQTWLISAISTLVLLVGMSSSAFAHGQAHQPEAEMSEHMQAMMAVKQEIPAEYRVMNRTPLRPDEDSLQQGQQLYLKNCSVCHGPKGDGKGPAAKAMQTPPANFLEKKHSAIYGPGEKYWLIGNGTKKTGMPAFTHFTPAQRWHLVNHILQLQEEGSAKQ